MDIKYQRTRTLTTKDNGRSSDAVSPNFIYGCLGGCMSSYCYVGRYNNNKLYVNTNTEDILQSIHEWSTYKPYPKVPNQIDPTYYCIDIGCSTDVPLHHKYYNWQRVFNFFNTHPILKSTFATKYPTKFKTYDLDPEKNRIRVSLMPQVYSSVLEPNTDSIEDRIKMIPELQKQLEVHINFSPIVFHDNWIEEYEKLFQAVSHLNFKSECIFLTYSNIQAERNSDKVNAICNKPEIQEEKKPKYGGTAIRYKWQLKDEMIEQFKHSYSKYIDPKTIRYIF
jgi:spore photoproduct lyase